MKRWQDSSAPPAEARGIAAPRLRRGVWKGSAMKQKSLEPEDPYELVGVAVPVPEGYDALGEMARCFVEEFALMGWSGQRILGLFQSPFYQGPHAVYRTRGEGFGRELIGQVLGEQ